MNRRSMMLLAGIAVLTAATPVPVARADSSRQQAPQEPVTPPAVPPTAGGVGSVLFADDFDGPPGSAPGGQWMVASWQEPGNLAHYRNDRRNVFLDGNSNLVIRATNEGGTYYSGRIQSNNSWSGGIGHTWEARIKLNCLTAGCWPAFWMLNTAAWDPVLHRENVEGGEIDVLEWFGNWPLWGPATTVHARSDGRTDATSPIVVDDDGWHRWRCQWDAAGMRFWEDYANGAPPYFDVPAGSIPGWPFNQPGYLMFPIFNIAIGGLPGGDPRAGTYPADMLIDWIRVW